MAISAGIVAGGTLAGSAYQAHQGRKARKKAEQQAALEREALAELREDEPPVMPIADDEGARRARRRSIAAQLRRRGRQSTILSDSSADPLGA